MKVSRFVTLVGIVGVLVAAAGSGRAASPGTGKIPGSGTPTVTGPYTHGNLSVYILHFDEKLPKEPRYITLSEGLKSKASRSSRRRSNRWKPFGFATRRPSPCSCRSASSSVAVNRTARYRHRSSFPPGQRRRFPPSASSSLAGRAARVSGAPTISCLCLLRASSLPAARAGSARDVRRQKQRARYKITRVNPGAGKQSKTSSINEELMSPDVAKLTKPYLSALGDLPREFRCPVGMVYAVSNRIRLVEAYHSSVLLTKLPSNPFGNNVVRTTEVVTC